MNRQFLMVVCVMLAAMAGWVGAVQPNLVETIIYDVDGSGSNIVTTEYSDGLKRGIQIKMKIDAARDRVSCSFYDEAGRPQFVTAPFLDENSPGTFLQGDLHDPTIEGQLQTYYSGDTHLYKETEYWDNPLGQVKTAYGPGATATYGFPRSWTIGVVVSATPFNYTVASHGTVTFQNGIITDITTTSDLVTFFDALYQVSLSSNPFGSDRTHFLTVARSTDEKISEEVKDLFGRTIHTFSGPDITIGGTTANGSNISAGYRYDLTGNVLEEMPPTNGGSKLVDGNIYQYNTLGQMIYKKTPDGGEYEYKYYDNGLMESMKTSVNGSDWWGLKYWYDDFGRQIRTDESTFSYGGDLSVFFSYYDESSAIPSEPFSIVPSYIKDQLTNLKGRLVATVTKNRGEQDIDIGELYSYDDEGRINRKILVISGSPVYQETVYEYDIHGKSLAEKFYYGGDHFRKRYSYDELGQLARVYNGVLAPDGTYDETELVHYKTDLLGRKDTTRFSTITNGGDYNVYNEFDIKGRLTSTQSEAGRLGFGQYLTYTPFGNNILSSSYNYSYSSGDAPVLASYVSQYVYDDINRLRYASTSLDGNTATTCSYNYDQAGRFLTKFEESSIINGYQYYKNTATGAERFTNRLKNTSKNAASEKEYVYDHRGNLIVDFTKNMVIRYDWRNLPVTYKFYDDLSDAGITKNEVGTCTNFDLYYEIKQKVDNNDMVLVSTVMMVYDAGGNRVCKMAVNQ